MTNDNKFNIEKTIINSFKETINFFFLGKYTHREYEYTIYLNGEEIKADDCFSNFFGSNFCKLNGVTYNNIKYKTTLINEYEKDGFIIGPIITTIFLSLLIYNFFTSLIRIR